jgi:forkhead box protein J2/3
MDLEQQQNQQRQLQQMIPPSMLTPPNQYFPDPNPDLTGGLPISLDSLRDGPPGSKPFYPYSTLIRFVSLITHIKLSECSRYSYSYAIKGSPTGKLLLEDIYYAIESRVGSATSHSSRVRFAYNSLSFLISEMPRPDGRYTSRE